MVIRNQTQSNCECDCDQRYRMPEPVIPPIVPVVSVKSVNGSTGDVVLRNLTIGNKVYNGTDNVEVKVEDFGVEGIIDYKGQHTAQYIESQEVKQGDLYYCTDENLFWLALAKGTGGFKKFPTLEELYRSAYQIELSVEDDTFLVTADLKDFNGNIISTSTIDLPIEKTIVKEAYYDPQAKAIVIIFQDDSKVVIPVGDLIADLSEKLDKEIQDRKDADAAIAGAINQEINDRQTADNNLQLAINTEAATRQSADEQLQTNINTETATRIQQDEALASSIRKEISDREAADINLQTNIDAEANTRKIADDNLAGAINQEVIDRKSAISKEVSDRDAAIKSAIDDEVYNRNAAIKVETDRAIAAEEQEVIGRNAAIKIETDRAKAAEAQEVIDRNTAITNAINALDENINVGRNLITNIKETKGIISVTTSKIEQSDITGLESRLSESDAKLNRAISDIATETSKREALDTRVNTISSKLDTEIQRSTEKDNDLDLAIKAETTRATGKENELNSAIIAEKTRAEGAELNLTTNLNNEISQRTTADNTLQTNITAEVERAKKAEVDEAKVRSDKDTELEGNISTLNTNLTNEISTRSASDNEFRSAIIDLRSKDTELASSITGEINRAKEAEQGLGSRITETNDNLNSEISRASGAESALTTSISKEVTDRTNADAVLATGLQSEQLSRESADTLEAQTRESADNALGARIDAITIPEYSMINLGSTTAYAGRYQMTKNTKGVIENVGVEIDVLRSNIIDDISVRTCYEKDVPIAGLNPGDKYLDFTYTVGGIQTHAYIAVKDMMKPISAGDYIVIDESNKISVSSVLSNQVAQNTNDIAKEATDRATAITAEKNERTTADIALQTNIDAEKTRAMAEVAQERVDRDAAILVETNRAKAVEDTKIDLLGTVPGTSIQYNLPYYFYVDVQENKVVVHAKTISLDNQKVQGDYTLDVNAATQTTAGLLSKDDKIKLDKIKFVDTTIDERD